MTQLTTAPKSSLNFAVQNVAEAHRSRNNEKHVAKCKASVAGLTNGYRLTRFHHRRARCKRRLPKLLGVLATVRNDFSTVSELMHPRKEVRPFLTICASTDHIFISNDLDRCRPAASLRAACVHLSRFKLFVVVVGVDARWVSDRLRRNPLAAWQASDGDDTPYDGGPCCVTRRLVAARLSGRRSFQVRSG